MAADTVAAAKNSALLDMVRSVVQREALAWSTSVEGTPVDSSTIPGPSGLGSLLVIATAPPSGLPATGQNGERTADSSACVRGPVKTDEPRRVAIWLQASHSATVYHYLTPSLQRLGLPCGATVSCPLPYSLCCHSSLRDTAASVCPVRDCSI